MRLALAEVLEATGGELLGSPAAPGFDAVSTDTRSLAPGSLFVALSGPRFDGHDYLERARDAGARAALIHRGRAPEGLPCVRVPDTLVALGALGRHVRRRLDLTVVAVTGSAGKTTTKEIAGAILRAAGRRVLQTPGNLNNRVGLPLTLLGAAGDEDVAVLELGISEPGEMDHLTAIAEPDVAVVTAVGTAHTEWLGDLAGVAREKLAVARGLRPGGTLVLPHGDPWLRPPAGVRTLTFGWDEGADLRGEEPSILAGGGSCFRVGGRELRLPLPGRHNARNALAALAVARLLGVAWEDAARALEGLRPPPLRGEVRETSWGGHLLVDCYNANPLAMEAALETLAGLAGTARKIAVLGEMKELGSLTQEGHERVGRAAAAAGVEALYLVGPETRWTRDAAVAAGMDASRVRLCSDREALLAALAGERRPGAWVLVKGSRAMGLEAVAEGLGKSTRTRTDEHGPTRTGT